MAMASAFKPDQPPRRAPDFHHAKASRMTPAPRTGSTRRHTISLKTPYPRWKAAFAAGADVVELDIHLTPDKAFAVMHDWTVDCRTEGKGTTQDLSIEYLKTLDLGYGYTAMAARHSRCVAKASA